MNLGHPLRGSREVAVGCPVGTLILKKRKGKMAITSQELLKQRMAKLGVLLTSHPKHRIFMDYGLQSWFNYPYHILLGYDDLEIPEDINYPIIKETFTSGYPAGKLGHVRGELTLMKEGGRLLADKGFEYIFKSASDTTCYRWYNFRRLFDVLIGGKLDFVLCGTAAIFGRVDSFNKCMELYHEHLTVGGAELYFDSQIRKFNMTTRREKAPFWESVLGRIHVQGEYAICNQITVSDTWSLDKV